MLNMGLTSESVVSKRPRMLVRNHRVARRLVVDRFAHRLARGVNAKGHVVVLLAPSPEEVAVAVCLEILLHPQHRHSAEFGAVMVFVLELVNEWGQVDGVVLALVNIPVVLEQHVDVVKHNAFEPTLRHLLHRRVHRRALVEVTTPHWFRDKYAIIPTLSY